MLRIAVPNKGSLAETAAQMLSEAGLHRSAATRNELHVVDPRNEVEFFYLRPRDIATYVGSGALDVGITGRDLLLDSGSGATEIAPLGFGGSTFRFAGPAGALRRARRPRGRARRHQLPGPRRRLPRRARRHREAGARSTAPSSRPCGSAWRMPSPTSSRPARPCARRASRSSARSSSSPRPC